MGEDNAVNVVLQRRQKSQSVVDDTTVVRARRARELRGRLLLGDVVALTIAAVVAETAAWSWHGQNQPVESLVVAAAMVATGLGLARWQQLYRTSRSSIRTVELAAVVRVAMCLGIARAVADRLMGHSVDPARAAIAALTAVVTLSIARSLFRSWLRARRAAGDYRRPIVVVGANHDAVRLIDVLDDHPESGFEVVGLCSATEQSMRAGLRATWTGDVDHAAELVRSGDATGAIVVATALETDTLNRVVRDITHAGGHVHLSSGLHGMATDRIAPEPIAHEPLLHIHPVELSARQVALKRVLDVALAALLLVVVSPALLASMAAIRLSDGGPAVFRQVRVGRGGRLFEVLKLRTMHVGAEELIAELAEENTRNGPLFKLDHDPRVTRIGRVLRATSIDELPQLWNVIRGEMSLVGPRPALPAEVEEFPPDLAKRTNVPPGITGLWQVEARDNPSFDAYARLDLFYVENWTITFDLVILLATAESELARVLGRVFSVTAEEGLAIDGQADGPVEVPVEVRRASTVPAVPLLATSYDNDRRLAN